MTASPQLGPALAAITSRLAGLQAAVAQLQRNQRAAQLGHSSVEGGTIVFNGADGSPQLVLGQQPDGTHALRAVHTDPPDTPSAPLVSAGIGGLYVIWDGLLATGAPPAASFGGVQVHASPNAGFTPGPASYQGILPAAGMFGVGGLTPGTAYYVVLVPVSAAGVTGTPSSATAGTPASVPASIPGGSITGDQVATGSITGDNIAAATIEALHLVGGIVVAGIVDATVIDAATLVGSVILGYAAAARGPVTFDFADGTAQGWTAVHATAANSTAWSSTGANSLLITADGTGQPKASSPGGALAIPVSVNDPVQLTADLQAPAALPAAYVGIQWYDVTGTTLLAETDSPDTALLAGQAATLSVQDIAPAAGFAVIVAGDHNTDASGVQLFIDNVLVSGNLAYSASTFGGTDAQGNVFDPGIEINGIPGLLEAITVQDAYGQQTLATIDAAGNITGQTISAAQDIVVGGQSLLSGLLTGPAGIVARTSIANASLPAPATATASEFYLYELDVQAVTGRAYLLVIEPVLVTLSGAGKVRVRVYVTTDGTQPTNASPLLAEVDGTYPGATANLAVATPPLIHPFSSAAGALWRLLVSVNSVNTGSGAPTMQVAVADASVGDDASGAANARMAVYDTGPAAANTGRAILSTAAGTGGGTQAFTTTYTATGSFSYQGSNSSQSVNAKLSFGKNMWVGRNWEPGGSSSGNAWGWCKTWILFDYATIAADLGSATITKIQVRLTNTHTYYSTGASVGIGWDTKTAFGSTAADPTGSYDQFEFTAGEGQKITKTLPASFGAAFATGGATTLVLWKPTLSLVWSSTFAGPSTSSPPQLIVTYTR